MKKYKDFRNCSVGRTLEVLGDKWIFLILREAFFGVCYFAGFKANLGIATNVLSDRLAHLVEHKVLEKAQDKSDARRVKYRLTGKGLELYTVTLALMQWGDRWLSGAKGPPLVLTHKTCGHSLDPVMCCGHCGKPVKPFDVEWEHSPPYK